MMGPILLMGAHTYGADITSPSNQPREAPITNCLFEKVTHAVARRRSPTK